jgi:two-component system chemotaxis response regulator CheB
MRPIRVVIADDSAGARLALAAGLRRIPGVEVVGTANDGVEVVGKVLQLRPDLVTLDLDMPNRDGVSAAAAIHRHCPDTVLALVSGAEGATAQSALAFAPNLPIEYIPKPAAGKGFDDWVAASLVPLLERLRERPLAGERARPWRRAEERPQEAVEAVLVGASTGGPAAVTTFLQGLDPDIGVPVLIVQHMPPTFTDVFARNLSVNTRWRVREAYDRAVVRAGDAWVAQGDRHMRIERIGDMLTLRLDDGPREHGCRPAVDVLFRSAARVLRGRCIGVMLTGMGRDGTPGATELHAEGASFVAQDEATSVVWGMPGALAQAGLAEAVLPLPEIAPWVASRIRVIRSRARKPGG